MALAIFSLMSIAAYKAIDGLMRVKERVGAENRQWQQVMLFLDRFELDVKQHANGRRSLYLQISMGRNFHFQGLGMLSNQVI